MKKNVSAVANVRLSVRTVASKYIDNGLKFNV